MHRIVSSYSSQKKYVLSLLQNVDNDDEFLIDISR